MATRFKLTLALCLISGAPQASFALSVTQPTAATVVVAGDDYATQVLGNAWDMNDSVDIETQESLNVTSQSFGSGIYSGVTTAADANVYPLFEGQLSSINLSRGARFPVDTSRYRYLTMKMKATQPGAPTEFSRVVFYQVNGTFGLGSYHALPNNAYFIFTNDMLTQIDGTSPHQWTDFPQVTGLRIDPATPGGAFTTGSQFSIDWIRLTAPATPSQKTTVQWTDAGAPGGSTYDLIAIDAGGTTFGLGNAGAVTAFPADTSFLPPGQYSIQVVRHNSAVSGTSATFRINAPAQVAVTAPSVRGDQSRAFAPTVVGNPWGPMDAADFSNVLNFTNVSYAAPAGSFSGRPTNNDPGLIFNLGGHPIDTSIYRSVCFTLEVFGVRSVANGSVARLFWGNSPAALTTSQDIVLDDNLNDTLASEYCIPDLAAVPLEPNPNGGNWSGTKSVFRLDPDEFTPPGGCTTKDTCHDVQLNSLVLAPFAQANPGYTFMWTLNDADNASVTLQLALDPDTNPANANEFIIDTQPATNGNGSFAWSGLPSVPNGSYHVLARVDDGINIVEQYAGGVIVVTSDVIFQDGFQ